jgi:hypothetical protein
MNWDKLLVVAGEAWSVMRESKAEWLDVADEVQVGFVPVAAQAHPGDWASQARSDLAYALSRRDELGEDGVWSSGWYACRDRPEVFAKILARSTQLAVVVAELGDGVGPRVSHGARSRGVAWVPEYSHGERSLDPEVLVEQGGDFESEELEFVRSVVAAAWSEARWARWRSRYREVVVVLDATGVELASASMIRGSLDHPPRSLAWSVGASAILPRELRERAQEFLLGLARSPLGSMGGEAPLVVGQYVIRALGPGNMR